MLRKTYRSDGKTNSIEMRVLERAQGFELGKEIKFDRDCYTGSNMLKYDLLDRVMEDLARFGNMETVDASLFEKSNVHMNL